MRACHLHPLQYLYFLKRCKLKLYIYCTSYTGLQGRTLLGRHDLSSWTDGDYLPTQARAPEGVPTLTFLSYKTGQALSPS